MCIRDRVGTATHWLFYLLIAAMVLSGIGTALSYGLFPIVYGGSGDPLPPEFVHEGPRAVHGIVSSLLGVLVILHILAAFYHQLFLKDGLFRRMGFGARRNGA